MTFTFNDGIPAANNNPSNDQPDMLINNQSTKGIIAVDHIGFDTNLGGNHSQMHLPQFSTSTAVLNGKNTEGSLIYTEAGIDDIAHAQSIFKTDNGKFITSAIRAFAYVSDTGAVLGNQEWNVNNIVRNSAGVYTVTLDSNATTSRNFIVLVSAFMNNGPFFSSNFGYNISAQDSFILYFSAVNSTTLRDPVSFSFVVIQA